MRIAPRAPDPVAHRPVTHAPVYRLTRGLDLMGAPPVRNVQLLSEARIDLNTGLTGPDAAAARRFDATA